MNEKMDNITDNTEELQLKRKKSVLRRILTALAWVVLSPVFLLLLLVVLLYVPAVQQFAVDTATDILSEQTGMRVSVGEVRLKFPLDLSLRRMTAVAESGDTVLDADELAVSVRLRPLLNQDVEVDAVTLRNVKVNTLDLVEAAQVEGSLGEFIFESHTTSLLRSEAVVSKALLADADLTVVLADSVAEDTTVEEPSEPLPWTVLLDDVEVRNVKVAVRSEELGVKSEIGSVHLTGKLDLRKELYQIYNLSVDGTSVSYDVGEISDSLQGFDANHIALTDIGVSLDSLSFAGRTGDLSLLLSRLEAKERSGLAVVETYAKVGMDSVRLYVDDLLLRTGNSFMLASAVMDMDAFSESNPGKLALTASASVGWKDLEYVNVPVAMVHETLHLIEDSMFSFNDSVKRVKETLPPIELDLTAKGTMSRLKVDHLDVTMEDILSVKAQAKATNLLDSVRMGADLQLTAEMLGINMVADGNLADRQAKLDADIVADDAEVLLSADYGLATEAYRIGMDITNLNVNKFVPMTEQLNIAGSLSAEGQGFDIYSKAMWADVALKLDTAMMGNIDLGSTHAVLKLKGGDVGLKMTCDNEQLRTALDMTGRLAQDNVSADLALDVPFADFKAMGLSETRLELQTKGQLSASYNMNDLFRVESDLKGLNLTMSKDTVFAEYCRLYAETMPDSTVARLHTGDLDFDFTASDNLFRLIDKGVAIGDMLMAQIEERRLDVEALKASMPLMALDAKIGQENPVSKMLSVVGVNFDEVEANIATSPDVGLLGNAHLYRLHTDSMRIDTAYFDISQDTTNLVLTAGVSTDEREHVPGFKALLDGYVGQKTADAHLTFLNGKGKTGIDLGVNATMGDSMTHVRLYPAEPVLAFNRFSMNQNNFIDLHDSGSIFADLELLSLQDSARIVLTAQPDSGRIQDARAVISNLNLGKVLEVVPFMPQMNGVIGIDANYVQTEKRHSVRASLTADRFAYEGALVGDLKASMAYIPEGDSLHKVASRLYYNEKEVASVLGRYYTEDEGTLDAILRFKDFPLEMATPFVPDKMMAFHGNLGGEMKVKGALDGLQFNGSLLPDSVRVSSEMYGFNLRFGDQPIVIDNSCLTFDKFPLYASGKNYLTLNGDVDFADFSEIMFNLSLYGRDFQLIDAKRTRKSVIFGEMYGNYFLRVNGTSNDMSVRGMVSVLNKTDMTYVMTDTPLSIDYRLEDIVTFVDFSAPPDTTAQREERTFMGMEMRIQLSVEDGARFRAEFSADRQSYVNVQGGGSLVMNLTPEGVLTLQGRYTVNEGEMKYALPVIPLKTFTLQNGSYIDFTGDPMNPSLNIAATERTKASVTSSDGRSRSVAFDVGLKITNTLSNMGLQFTINAPEDLTIQNELAGMSAEEKNKLAVAMLATGMYLSSSNEQGFSAGNALNNFLQNEINNIAGQALNTAVEVNVGMEQNTRDDGSTRTDYSFKFSKRLFSDRLNIIIGGKISADGSETSNESGAYIDDVSLEWRLDNGGTRYVRVFHEKNYDNLIEGELIENGAGIVLRKKLDNLSELFIFKKKK